MQEPAVAEEWVLFGVVLNAGLMLLDAKRTSHATYPS